MTAPFDAMTPEDFEAFSAEYEEWLELVEESTPLPEPTTPTPDIGDYIRMAMERAMEDDRAIEE